MVSQCVFPGRVHRLLNGSSQIWLPVFVPLRFVDQCVCAMADTTGGPTSDAEASVAGSAPAASSVPTSPEVPPSEPSSAGGSSASSVEGRSDLLQRIKALQDAQKALKDQKKKCAKEIKNAMKRKQRLQTKASQLSDSDLVEVLRMRKATRRESGPISTTTPPSTES